MTKQSVRFELAGMTTGGDLLVAPPLAESAAGSGEMLPVDVWLTTPSALDSSRTDSEPVIAWRDIRSGGHVDELRYADPTGPCLDEFIRLESSGAGFARRAASFARRWGVLEI